MFTNALAADAGAETEPDTLSSIQADQLEGASSPMAGVLAAATGARQEDSQRAPQTEAAKGDVDSETTVPSLLRASSVETIMARESNPAILIQDFPLTTPSDLNTPPATIKPAKFKSNNIVVPDYRWTKDQGMIASPTAPSLDLSNMNTKTKILRPSGVTISLFAPVSTSSWADQISPRTLVSPVQYANAPPIQAWQKPKAGIISNLCADKGVIHAGASSPEAPEESPFLPITAYSFSTDSSSPPPTPAEQRQEVVTPENEEVDLPTVGVYLDPAGHLSQSHPEHNGWQKHAHSNYYPSDTYPAYGDARRPAPLQAWMVDACLHQMSQVPADEMWSGSLASGYGVPKSRFQLAKQLAKQARAGDLPPQVPQTKTNYRSTCHL